MIRLFFILVLASTPAFAGPFDDMLKEMSKAIAEDIDRPSKTDGTQSRPTASATPQNNKGGKICGNSDIGVGQTLSWTLTPQTTVPFSNGKYGYGLVNIHKEKTDKRACTSPASSAECTELTAGYRMDRMNLQELKSARFAGTTLYVEEFPYAKLWKYFEKFKEDQFIPSGSGGARNPPPPVRFSTTVRWAASGSGGTECVVVATFSGFDDQASKAIDQKVVEADAKERAGQQDHGKFITDLIHKHAKTVRVPANLLASMVAVQLGGSLGFELIQFIDLAQTNPRSKATYEMEGKSLIMRHRITDPVKRKSLDMVYVFVPDGNEAVLGRMVMNGKEIPMKDISQVFLQIAVAMKNG